MAPTRSRGRSRARRRGPRADRRRAGGALAPVRAAPRRSSSRQTDARALARGARPVRRPRRRGRARRALALAARTPVALVVRGVAARSPKRRVALSRSAPVLAAGALVFALRVLGEPKGAIGSRTGLSKSTPASAASFVAELLLQHLGAHLLDEPGLEVAELERPEGEADQPVHREAEMLEDPLDLAVLALAQAERDPDIVALDAVERRLDGPVVHAVDR